MSLLNRRHTAEFLDVSLDDFDKTFRGDPNFPKPVKIKDTREGLRWDRDELIEWKSSLKKAA
jgi:predicted DNA-binding transcriptional regulator AlpA